MSENETIADIVVELQRCGDKWTDDKAKTTMECLGLIAIQFARRIEAAWKRERDECRMLAATTIVTEKVPVGNAAATYEALEKVRFYLPYMVQYVRLNWEDVDMGGYYDKILGIIEAALSAPPRNCDVGTAEEQAERQKAYCRKHFTPDQLGGNCRQCPLKDRRGWSCQLAWAQMPYEAKE
jgi:hypothetical protein